MHAALVLAAVLAGTSDDGRTQYPAWLANSYFDVNVGYIQYPFSSKQLEPGHTVTAVRIPHPGVRITLLGHNFSKNLSAQVTYARPGGWITYEGLDGTENGRTVWMNIAGLTGRTTAPLGGPFSVYLEGGLGIVTRHGFDQDGRDVVRNATYATLLAGAGLKYRLSRTWDLQAGALYTPPNDKFKQPQTVMFTAGAVVNMRPIEPGQVRSNARSDVIFPRNLVQVGHSTNELGTGVNHLFAAKVPIFWGGNVHVERGIHLLYQRNVFHTARVFSLDLGASVGNWWEESGQNFWTFSVYPRFRWTVVRTRPLDAYLTYSVAGPTYITKADIGGHDTGTRFTFQDLMGAGVYLGDKRQYNFEASIGHYSNGNIFPRNAGVKIPLTVSMGWAF